MIELVRGLSPSGDLNEAKQKFIMLRDTAASLGSIVSPAGPTDPGSDLSKTLLNAQELHTAYTELEELTGQKRKRIAKDTVEQARSADHHSQKQPAVKRVHVADGTEQVQVSSRT